MRQALIPSSGITRSLTTARIWDALSIDYQQFLLENETPNSDELAGFADHISFRLMFDHELFEAREFVGREIPKNLESILKRHIGKDDELTT